MVTKDINSQTEINKRLLKSFSVNALKEVFNLTGSTERQEGLLQVITSSNSEDIIYDEIFKHFSLLKQHIYLYEFKGAFNDNWLDKHPNIFSKVAVSKSNYIYNLLIPVTYEAYNKSLGVNVEFKFLVPVQIIRKKTILIFHINILERDISTITTDKILGATRDLNDAKILDDIIKYANPIQVFRYDLNRGIKYLWENDEIDALKVKFKNAKSISHEVMDEQNLVKKEYPAKYKELIKQPLHQTTFRVLIQQNLVHYFTVDATLGTFNFYVYPKHLNGINDLIDLVLKNN